MNINGQPANKVARGATKSWTIWFAVALAVFGALQLEMDHLSELVSRETFGWFNILIAVVVAARRVATTK